MGKRDLIGTINILNLYSSGFDVIGTKIRTIQSGENVKPEVSPVQMTPGETELQFNSKNVVNR